MIMHGFCNYLSDGIVHAMPRPGDQIAVTLMRRMAALCVNLKRSTMPASMITDCLERFDAVIGR